MWSLYADVLLAKERHAMYYYSINNYTEAKKMLEEYVNS